MKYGTVLRIARLALIIGIVAMLVVPLVISISNTDAKQMSAGIESRYDLTSINTDETIGTNIIKVNLQQIDGLGDKFYVGVDSKDLKEFFGDTSESRISEAAGYIYQEMRDNGKEAVVYDSEKNVCLQKSIQYHDGINTKIITGMKVPDRLGGMASVDISMRLVGRDVSFDIPFGSSTMDNGYLKITTEIPDLLLMLSNSIGHDMSFKVFVTIMGMASFNVDVDVYTEAIKPFEASSNSIIFEKVAIGSPVVTVGNSAEYKYYDDSGKIVLHVTSGTASLSETISSEKVDGKIVLKYKNTAGDEKTAYIEKEYADDIVSMVKFLEGKNNA